MATLFIQAFLGHIIGDYLFQTDYMAFNKKSSGWKGVWACTFHCLTYVVPVCLFLWTSDWLVWLLVFASHWAIDRTKFVAWWMDKVKRLSFKKAESAGTFLTATYAFLSIVVDNTFHFLSLWLIIKFLMT